MLKSYLEQEKRIFFSEGEPEDFENGERSQWQKEFLPVLAVLFQCLLQYYSNCDRVLEEIQKRFYSLDESTVPSSSFHL